MRPSSTKVEFIVKIGIASEQILQACHALSADLLILGLNRTEHIETASHLPWSMAHKIVCGASCPVLTIKNGSRHPGSLQALDSCMIMLLRALPPRLFFAVNFWVQ
jgi:hypothetical protein